jgi:dTDP-4-dehydrorhamnose reductase
LKVLIIALESQIRDALEAHLTIRNRVYQSVGIDWLLSAEHQPSTKFKLPDDIGVVVNIATLELLQGSTDAQLDALEALVKSCEKAQVPLLQLSSSQVFDGAEGGRHKEDEEVLSSNAEAKVESLVQGACERHIILRTGPVFSSKGDNLLTRLIPSFKQQATLKLSSVDKSCPLHADDVARVVSAIIDQLSCGCESWGVYHYSSSEPASHFQFAETVLAVVSQYIESSDEAFLLEPADIADEEWRRPLLNCEKIFSTFGIKQLPWRAFIVPTVKTLFNDQSEEIANE